MSSRFVVDSSFILKYLLKDEQNNIVDERVLQFIKKEIHILAPEILGVEVANALRSAFLRKRIEETEAREAIKVFIDLEIERVGVPVDLVLRTAFKLNISCYDASYVVLAHEKNARLLTFDARLKKLAEFVPHEGG